MKSIIQTLAIVLIFASCKTTNLIENQSKQLDNTVFLNDTSYQYKIRKDDKISISVWGEDNLSIGSVYGIYNSNEIYGKWLLVDANGNIEIPRMGTKHVVGKTVIALKEEIKKELSKLLVTPIVDVKVLNKEITIVGEVRNPNTFQVDKEKNNLLEVISKTGGFDFYANLKSIKILRQEGLNVKVTSIDLTQSNDSLNNNVLLYPGDIVIVPSKKYKEFDKRLANIIPFTTAISTLVILMRLF